MGRPVDLSGLLSAGTRVDVETRFRPGRCVMASFYAGTGAGARSDVRRGLLTSFKVR